MNIWIVTNVRMTSDSPMAASAIQNSRTAVALARHGHRVLLWLDRPGRDWQRPRGLLQDRLGCAIPENLSLFAAHPGGPREDKRTPFATPWARWSHWIRAQRIGGRPDAIISRSPLALAQLRRSWARNPDTLLLLEYQYPEYMQLWRGWRRRNPSAPLDECKAQLRKWKQRELRLLHAADGILRAAKSHIRLLKEAEYSRPHDILPSGCPEPDEYPKPVEPKYDFGYVGGLAPENGLDTLLEAVAQIDGATLCLVGGGRELFVRGLRERADQSDLKGRVHFEGAIAPHEARSRMRLCRIGVVPISRRFGPEKRQYASPLKLAEWAAARVPVVASDVASVSGMAQAGRDVLLSAPDDPEAWADTLGALLRNPREQKRLAVDALFFAQKRSFANRAARIEAFIRRLRGGM